MHRLLVAVLIIGLPAFAQDKKPAKTADTWKEALYQVELEKCEAKRVQYLEATIAAKKEQREKDDAEYNALVDKHNKLVADYNALLAQYKAHLTSAAAVIPVTTYTVPAPSTLPPPREPLWCVANTMGSITSINCR